MLFTEFGYRSIDYSTAGHWEKNGDSFSVNLEAQANAYQAFFETFWKEEWVAGGFFWKWFPDNEKSGGPGHKDFTPQNKKALRIVHLWYNKDPHQ